MRIGIVGGGQLGRMLALAGAPFGWRFQCLDPDADSPAFHVADARVAPFHDRKALRNFARGLDLVTFESENLPAEAIALIAEHTPVYPPLRALEVGQDRLHEKRLFQRLGIATAPFATVDDASQLANAIAELGTPSILKTRRGGYDGRGQVVIGDAREIESAWKALPGVPSILEGRVQFEREISIVAVRGRDGSEAFYPPVENHHEHGCLRLSIAPAPALDETTRLAAEDIARRVMRALDYVGVLAIELFQVGDALWANELAPRVHNSGHWTIEGADTSQFENHLRAIAGLPLGSTRARGRSAMVNLLGELPPMEALLAVRGAHVHVYGKRPAPGRKLGHVTVCADDEAELLESLHQLAKSIPFRLPAA